MNRINEMAPAYLNSVLTASQNGVMVYHAVRNDEGEITDLRLAMINDIASRDFGKPGTDLLGELFSRLFPKAVQAELFDRYRRVIETGESTRFTFQHLSSGRDKPSWYDISVASLQESIVVSYDNITKAKVDAETALQNSIFEQAFNSSVNGITVYEAVRSEQGHIEDFRFAMINDAGVRMNGLTREELLGKSVWQIYPATKINGLFDQYVEVYETGEPVSGEKYYPEYDLWCDYSIVPVPLGVMITYTDRTAHNKMIEETRQQAHVLASVLESVPVSLVVLEAVQKPGQASNDFRIVNMNHAFRKAFDLSSDESGLLPNRISQIGQPMLLDACVLCHDQQQPHTFDLPVGQPQASNWYQVSIAPDKDLLVVSLTDITAFRNTQADVQFQADLLQSLNDSVPTGMVLWEAVRDNTRQQAIVDFRYRRSNLIDSYVTGYSEEFLLGKDLFALFPRLQGSAMEIALRDTIETGFAQRMIFHHYTEKPERWIDAQFCRLGNNGSAELVLMTYMDVTEQHKSQLAQKKQADLFKTVINQQPAGLILFDPVREGASGSITDFTYVLVNETQLRVSGRSARETIGQRMRTLHTGADRDDIFRRMITVAEDGQAQEWLQEATVDGIDKWFQASLVRHGSQVLYMYLDVSDLKLQQQELEIANLDLRRSNENLQQFAYVASHDLQEPLRKIQSFGDLLATGYGPELDENARSIIKRMQMGAGRMSTLIRDLLLYSRLSTQRVTYNRVSLSRIASQVIQDIGLTIQETGAVIELEHLADVTGDELQLGQLLQNLILNAIKFRQEGITPRIRVSSQRVLSSSLPAGVIIEGNLSHWYHEITVSDNGIGFDVQYLDRIFQVFQRLHSKDTYAGSGIGLAICLKVIQNHDGGITATSQPGAGSTFSVYLPVNKQSNN